MELSPTPTEDDTRLLTLIEQARLNPPPPTPEEQTLTKLRAKLVQGAIAPAQRLARTLRSTFNYPDAMVAIAEAQQQAGQQPAAYRTLRAAQRRIQQFYEGDHMMGYPRADYLLYIVRAQLRLGDLDGARYTAHTITEPQDRAIALQLVEQVSL